MDRYKYRRHILGFRGRHCKSRSRKSLIERLYKSLAYAEHLSSRLHLRAEYGVCVVKLFKGEYRYLYRAVRRGLIKPGAVSQIL